MELDSPNFKEVLTEIITALSRDKKQVKVTEVNMASKMSYTIQTSVFDHGKVIGTLGKNFKAFERFVKIRAARESKEGHLSVPTPEGMQSSHTDFKANPKWGRDQIDPLLRKIGESIFDLKFTTEYPEPDDAKLNIELTISPKEQLAMADKELEVVIERILTAIGKANGKDIVFSLARNYAEERRAFAAGRR